MEILGIIDTLESKICDSLKIPLVGKIIIDEAEVLNLLDKMRLVLQNDKGYIGGSMSNMRTSPVMEKQEIVKEVPLDMHEASANEIIQKSYQISNEIKAGADRYADEVLSNLEATADRILRTVKNGRFRLSKNIGSELKLEDLDKDIQN